MSKARNLSKVIVDSSGIVDRDSLDVETVAKTGSYNDLTDKPTITSGTVTSVAASAGTGISVSGSPITSSGTITITNTAPDQTVALTAGTGISTSGTYPNFTITNSAPDQTVALTQGGTTTITGTYPNFSISSADQYVGTVTSVSATVPTGLSVSGTPVTSSGTLAITYAAGYSIPTDTKQTNWDTAYGWGDHSTEGYLTSFTETDPVFTASEAASITSTDTSNWDTAYGWGNHASAGYLTSYTETDPVYTASSWYSTTNNASNWDTAYGWGNHASAGYATYPSQTGNTGKYLTTDGSTTSWATVDALPSQTGNTGKYLTTDGSTASWATINVTPALDDLSDVTITSVASGDVLSYNGSAWVNTAASSGGGQYFGTAAVKAIAYNSNTISENITITSGNNAMSVGNLTISSGYAVTVESGCRWVVL
jgi:hypothetical protein